MAPHSRTASASITDTVNGSHEFNVVGYSLTKGLGIGNHVSSDTFTVGGYNWAIYFYPDGKSKDDNAQYVSMFIALAGEGSNVRALFEIILVDQSGKGNHKVHSHFDRLLEQPYVLKYQGSMWGYKRFFRRTALEKSDFLKDDCLRVRCRVGVVRSFTIQALKPISKVGKKTQANRACLSCGQTGHLGKLCPKKNQHESATGTQLNMIVAETSALTLEEASAMNLEDSVPQNTDEYVTLNPKLVNVYEPSE